MFAIFGAVLFTSCEKNTDVQPEERVEKEISLAQMSYAKNQYDQQGVLHNAFLDHLESSLEKNLNQEGLLNLYNEFYVAQKMEFGEEERAGLTKYMDTYSEMRIGGPFPTIPLNICRWIPVICDILNPSPTFPYTIPLNILNSDNGGTSTERTTKFIESLKVNEDKIMSDESLSDDHRKALLNQHAIARFSAGYWHNVNAIQKGKSGYYDYFQEADVAKICHTCDVVGADAAGAALGALVGGVGAGPGAGVASGIAVAEKIYRWWKG